MAEDPEQLHNALAHNIRALREARGWDQKELAERAQCRLRYLAKVETGNATVRIDALTRFANALGVTVVELLATPARARAPNRRARI